MSCGSPVGHVDRTAQGPNVPPLAVGRSIVATWEPNQTTVLEAIRELGLELQIIFNKGAVMILPAGMNKAAGLLQHSKTWSFRRTMSSVSVMPRTTMLSCVLAGVRPRSPMPYLW